MKRVRLRTVFELVFVAATPVHVGSGRGSVVSDAELARDARGRLIVPGTSLAGVLRSRTEELLSGDQPSVSEMFGRSTDSQTRDSTGRSQPELGSASRVIVGDSEVGLPAEASTQLIQGVGIERMSGTAAERFLYDRVTLPAGTKLVAPIEVIDTEVAGGEEADETLPRGRLARRLLEVLADISPYRSGQDAEPSQTGNGDSVLPPDGEAPDRRLPLLLGAATARGLGQLQLDATSSRYREIRYETEDLVGDLLEPPSYRRLSKSLGSGPSKARAGHSSLVIEITWEALGPLMLRGSHDSVVDFVPRFGFDGQAYALTLPGASIKGALRATAERIVRTVCPALEQVDPAAADDPSLFSDQINVPLVRDLFGLAKTRDGGWRGAVVISDLYALSEQHRFASWSEVENLLAGEEQPDRQDWFQRATHVAIDRFTGGAAAGLLFDVLEPHGVQWPAIRLLVELDRIADERNQRWAAVGLLLLTIQEFAAGMVPLGAFAERGSGDIRVTRVRVEAPAYEQDSGDKAGNDDGRTPLWDVDDRIWQLASSGWRDWIRNPPSGAA